MSDRELSYKLKKAVNDGDLKTVQRLVKGGVDVNARFWYDSTLLHEAVSMSSAELVSMLIKAGADVNSINQDGRTALHLACRGGQADIVHLLISAGTSVNKRTLDGKTCLHVAVWRGHENVVRMLVDAGADVNIPDSDGCPPLYWAARSNYLSITQMLVESGAKVNYRVKSKWTPLHIALHLGHMSIVRYLLLQGAETNIVIENKTVVSLLMENKHLSPEVVVETLKMFSQAGYNLHRDTWSPAFSASVKTDNTKPQNHPLDTVVKWLDKQRVDIPSLTCLCRTRVRKRLSFCNKGRSIATFLPQLPLPTILTDFLSFKGEAVFQHEQNDLISR